MSIDYARLAKKAGLDADQIESFTRGVRGEGPVGELLLDRSRYDRLQALFEEAEAAVPLADGEVFRFCYLTRALLTPFYRPDHPRFRLAGKLFDARDKRPMACAVATIKGFNEQKAKLDPLQKSLLETRLRNNLASEEFPSICLTRISWGEAASVELPAANYLALPSTQARPRAVAFHATQGGPEGLSRTWGSVLFGDRAQGLAVKALGEWRTNAQEWGSHKILRLLNGD